MQRNRKLKLYFIDPGVGKIVKERLSEVEEKIGKIDQEFSTYFTEVLSQPEAPRCPVLALQNPLFQTYTPKRSSP